MKKIGEQISNIPEGAKAAFTYTFASVFSRGLAIITVPIFTRLMSTEQIGIVNLFNSWNSMLGGIATLSLTSGGFAVAMKKYSDRRDEYQSSVLTLTSTVSMLMAIIFFLNIDFWSGILELPTGLIVLMLLGFLLEPARDFWMARQRYEYKYKSVGIVSILTALLASLGSVIVVCYMSTINPDHVGEGRLYANYSIIFMVALLIWVPTMIRGKTFYSKEFWKMSLSLSLPLVGYTVASQILNVSDRLMISKMIGLSAVGIYSTLYTVSSLANMVWQAINSSFVPYLFQNIDKPKNNIKKLSTSFLIVYAGVALLLVLFAPEIVSILAPREYYEAIYIMPPIAAGIYFSSLSNLYSNIVVYYQKTKYVMYPAMIGASVNVVLNWIFIPIYGYIAASYTTLVAYMILALTMAIWANKLYRANGGKNKVYDDSKIIIISLFVVIISLVVAFTYEKTGLRYTIIILGLVLLIVKGRKFYEQYKTVR